MALLLKGVLVEYGSDVLGPLPNIVVFQFNPDKIARTMEIAAPMGGGTPQANRQREPAQVASPPTETFQITAHFSAADDLGKGGAASVIPRVFGIGPQLAALEKMVYTQQGLIGKAIAAAVDAIGDALGVGGGDEGPTRAIPREASPRILFIWGPSRVLPVEIRSMSITEQKFDFLLNPVQAEVQIGFAVASFPPNSDDKLGKGALTYTQTVKDAQAVLNLGQVVASAVDLVLF